MTDGEVDQGEVLDLAEFPETDEEEIPSIAFTDDPEDGEDETPLIKQLRDQLRERDRKLSQYRRSPPAGNEVDPEPAIPAIPNIEALEWDQDRFDADTLARDNAVASHAEWKNRQSQREQARLHVEQEQARTIDQQRKALGVSDYEGRAATVKESLSDQQLAVLVSGVDDPAKLIYALGGSPSRLAQIAGQDNLAKFAVMIGKMEKDIRVSKRRPPAVETTVRGATASIAVTNDDKELERLEREADRTNDRSKIVAYKRELRARKAA